MVVSVAAVVTVRAVSVLVNKSSSKTQLAVVKCEVVNGILVLLKVVLFLFLQNALKINKKMK